MDLSKREVDVLSVWWLELRDTDLILMIPIFYLRNKGLGHFGYRLAKARLGRQEA